MKKHGVCRACYESLRRHNEVGGVVACSVESCGGKAIARGLCDRHYRRFMRKGTTDRSAGWRLRNKYAVDATSGCWNWTDSLRSGYGFLVVEGQKIAAHRVSYEHHVGPIPDGMQLDHLCRNRACVNPAHLEPVTAQVNVLRGEGMAARWARRTACHVCGGEFSISGGRRVCVVCRRRRVNARNAARRGGG